MKKLTLILVAVGALLSSCSRQEVATIQPNKMERIVNLQDLKEYIEWDIANGKDKDGNWLPNGGWVKWNPETKREE